MKKWNYTEIKNLILTNDTFLIKCLLKLNEHSLLNPPLKDTFDYYMKEERILNHDLQYLRNICFELTGMFEDLANHRSMKEILWMYSETLETYGMYKTKWNFKKKENHVDNSLCDVSDNEMDYATFSNIVWGS